VQHPAWLLVCSLMTASCPAHDTTNYDLRLHLSPPPADDHPTAKQVLDAWFAKYGLGKLPKIIIGISSGAAFAIKFPRTFPGLAGVVSGELGVQPCTWETQLAGGGSDVRPSPAALQGPVLPQLT